MVVLIRAPWFFLLFWSMILSLSLSRCVYVCVSVSFFSDLWVFLSVYLSLSVCVYVCVSVSALLMLSVEVLGIAEIGPFFGLKPSRSSFHFLIFPVWLLRKWGKRVLFWVWNPIKNEATPWVLAVQEKKRKKEKRKKRKNF